MIDYDGISHEVYDALSNLPTSSKECCIYNVPRHLRATNEAAYVPRVISIGPLHRHADHLQHNHHHKLNYLHSFLQVGARSRLETCLKVITGSLRRVQECYAEPSVRAMDAKELMMIVLVDAAFLIELFRRSYDPCLIDESDQMFHRPRMVVEVGLDVLLEENQLPLFILRELYDAAYGGAQERAASFMEIACEFLGVSRQTVRRPGGEDDCRHFLDLLRANYLPSQLRHDRYLSIIWDKKARKMKEQRTPTIVCKTATALSEAGLKFRVADESSPLDIRFDEANRTLTIPMIRIQDNTEALFRNLAVYEQCHYYTDTYIIDYILFLDFLISTPSDVALLAKQGIIENLLGSDERVAELFNSLGTQLSFRTEYYYYAEQTERLKPFYDRRWNHYRAMLQQKYFSHPWAAISVVYAAVLLILTVLQVFTGFKSLK